MAKGFKHGAGGGGAPLNFKVVGGTSAPASPKENTIWVNTDAEITSWIFSGTEPENPTEGMVWISIGTSSTVEFNALKKNGIQVYPISAKQYVSGAWVDVTVKSYQNGAWVDTGLYLVQSGVDITALTGGWQDTGWGQGTTLSYPSITFENGVMSISSSTSPSSWGKSTKQSVDLTDIESIAITCDATAAGGAYSTAGMSAYIKMMVGKSPTSVAAQTTIVERTSVSGTFTLNVSSLTGEYYIGFFGYLWADGKGSTSINISDFELKRE